MPCSPSIRSFEISLKDLDGAFRADSGRKLAQPASIAVYFTELPSSGYTSALAVSPRDEVFLWAPPGINHLIVPVSRSGENHLRWTQHIAESRSARKRFRGDLLTAGTEMGSLPYGSVAYIAPDMGKEELWSPGSAPLWPGWFRAYPIPSAPGAREALVAALEDWYQNAGRFGTRAATEAEVSRTLASDSDERVARDANLFWREPESANPREYRDEYTQILRALTDTIACAAESTPISPHDLSPTFQVENCRLFLLDYGVKDERRRLSEAVGKYRARLLRVLRWPIFIELAAAELYAQQSVGRVLAAYGSEPTPYDGWEELRAYLDDMRESYPSFFSNPLDKLYAAPRAA